MNEADRSLMAIHRRAGFTLLELLLTLALSTTLLLAVSSSLYGYYRWRDGGQRQVDNARSLNAIFRTLGTDFANARNALNFTESFSAQLQGDALPSISVSTEAGTERALDFGFDFSLEPLVLYGDSKCLALGTMKPQSGRASSILDKRPSLKHSVVVWSSESPKTWRIPYAGPGGSVAFRSLRDAERAGRSVLPAATRNANKRAVRRSAVRLADKIAIEAEAVYPPEFQDIGFRYWDGEAWQGRWDSLANQRLPLAVEVSLRRRSASEIVTRVFGVSLEIDGGSRSGSLSFSAISPKGRSLR